MEQVAGKGIIGGAGGDMHHFCSHSSGQNSVTGLHGAAWDM